MRPLLMIPWIGKVWGDALFSWGTAQLFGQQENIGGASSVKYRSRKNPNHRDTQRADMAATFAGRFRLYVNYLVHSSEQR